MAILLKIIFLIFRKIGIHSEPMVVIRQRVRMTETPFGVCGDSSPTFVRHVSSGFRSSGTSEHRAYCHEGRSRGIGQGRLALRCNAMLRDGRPSEIRKAQSNEYKHQQKSARPEAIPCPKDSECPKPSAQGAGCEVIRSLEEGHSVAARKSMGDPIDILVSAQSRTNCRRINHEV